LPSCRADIWHLKQVLEHRSIGAFDSVCIVPDPTAVAMRQAIREFLDDAGPDDLALLYVSGHGTRLSASTGEFFFAASDTDIDQVSETAVSAGYVNDLLESCRAPQKVAVLDCCQSGGFAVGFRTRDAKGTTPAGQPAALTTRGVYILSSSGAGESSYSGTPSADGVPAPSVFTGEIIEALYTGEADADGDGKVGVEELFHHVNARVRSRPLASPQVPLSSSHGVNARIIIANVAVGPVSRLDSMPADLTGHSTPDAAAHGMGTTPQRRVDTRAEQWSRLLDYYQRCLLADTTEPPLMHPTQDGANFVCLSGPERFLSGADADQPSVEVPDHAVDLVGQAMASGEELWAGYPAVLLYGPPAKPWPKPRFAPLLVRQLDVVQTDAGLRLEPYGPVRPNPALIRHLLDRDDAQQLMETYCPSWQAGRYQQMAKDNRAPLPPVGPISTPIGACEADSTRVSTRAFGNADGCCLPPA
jgi:hypothetical protein